MNIHSIHATSAQIKGIYRESINLKRQGWIVLAKGIPGYQQPPEIEGYTPDIYAINGNLTYIILIDHFNSIDPLEKIVLRNYAQGYANMVFFIYLVNNAGCRITVEQ